MDNHEVVHNDGQPERGSLTPEKEQCGKVGLVPGLHPVRAVEFQAEKPISFAATYRSPPHCHPPILLPTDPSPPPPPSHKAC